VGRYLLTLDILIKEKTGLTCSLAEDPLTCVVRGCGMALENINFKTGYNSIIKKFESWMI
jgi:actin-like ATPase involved in cell morphogenesis